MRKPGTDEQNVKMTDVICDFCHCEWTEEKPMLEGHHGSCICGNCLTVAYTEIVIGQHTDSQNEDKCTMCLESGKDRASLNRGDEPCWQSPIYSKAVACRRCIELAANALHKDKDFNWSKPETEESSK